jgi:hypothetical protein
MKKKQPETFKKWNGWFTLFSFLFLHMYITFHIAIGFYMKTTEFYMSYDLDFKNQIS